MTLPVASTITKNCQASAKGKQHVTTQWRSRAVSSLSANVQSSIIKKILVVVALLFLFLSSGFALQENRDLSIFCPQFPAATPVCYDFPHDRPWNRCSSKRHACVCYPIPTTPNACFPMKVDEDVCYSSAIKDAKEACAGENHPLVPLPKEGDIDVVTWSAQRHWSGYLNSQLPKSIILGRATWVASSEEMQSKCHSWKKLGSKLKTRVNQVLGLPPTNRNDVFVVMKVASNALKRPCIGVDMSDPLAPRCTLMPTNTSMDALWDRRSFCSHMNSSFSQPNQPGYPFTGLGYSFDWSPSALSDYGVSEFVLPKDTAVTIRKIVQPDDYCSLQTFTPCEKARVVILGGGVAGLTAAMELEHLKHEENLGTNTLVVTGPLKGGIIAKRCETLVNGWHGAPISGYGLARSLHRNALNAGVPMTYEKVTAVDLLQRPFRIFTNTSETYFADAVIIATGFQPKTDPLRGFTPYPDCNSFFYDNKVIGVMGGGGVANVNVDYLSQFAKNVFLYNGRPAPASPARFRQNVRVSYNASVVNDYCLADSKKRVLEIETDTTCQVQEIDDFFVSVGSSPKSSLFHIKKKEDETILVDPATKKTSIEGVFAIGAVSGANSLSQAEADGRAVARSVLLELGC